MGLISAIKNSGVAGSAMNSLSGVLADQWKEYIICESIPADVLVVKGEKRTQGRSVNTKGSDNIISNGSVIAVADGQCMIIVEQGKVVDICAEPGAFIYDSSTEPSLLDGGNLGDNIKSVFATIGKRFTFGGDTGNDQRVYYFNIKEIIGNKYGTPSPVPFRVVDQRAGIDIDISIKCFGEYSYKITNPILFYTNVCANVASEYRRSEIDSQLKSELLTALQPAFARISEQGVRYSAVPGHTKELAEALREELTAEWKEARGIEIQKVGVSSIKADEEDEKMLKELQKNAAFTNPTLAAANLVGAQASAMQSAANNPNGAMMGFMGMGMAQQAGGMNAQSLFQMGQQQQMAQQMAQPQMQQAAPAAPVQMAPQGDVWMCPSCNKEVSGKFCPECGSKKPEAAPAPAVDGWTCSCGAVNQGKFCQECGAKKPAGVPQYKCDKCGWVPEDPTNPPKFCPECGDPFGDEDITNA